MSKTWKVPPSDLFFVHSDELTTYSFNHAVLTFGLALEAAMENAASGAKTDTEATRKRQRVMDSWLTPKNKGPRAFKDPSRKG